MSEYPNLIDGDWKKSMGGVYFGSTNPANTSDVIGYFPNSTNYDLEMTIEAAKKAYPAWKKLGLVKRSEFFWRFARLIEDNTDELARAVCRESGKQINEARADVIEAFHMCQYSFAKSFEGVVGQMLADEISEKDCFSKLRPRGIVACITPWNFPMAIPLWEIGMAMAYGNVVILKPSEETPHCAHLLADLIQKAGFPPGVFQLLHGYGEEVGWQLVCHLDVNSVLFTGSYEVGAKIKEEVARHYNKICAIETGSKSAVIVLNDAKIDQFAIPASIASAFKTAGQRCVSAGRIIVERSRYEEVCEKFVSVAERLRVGDPFDENVFYGPMINHAGAIKGKGFNVLAKDGEFTVLLERNHETPPTSSGHWLMPFVYSGKWNSENRVHTDEAFSPHVAIIPALDVEHAIHIYNDTRYGLSVSVITEDYRRARLVEDEVDAGIYYWNLPCIGAGVRLPFGGLKASGNLVPSAAGILPAITHHTSSTYNRGEEIVMAQGLNIQT